MAKQQTFRYNGLDGYAGFRLNQEYELSPDFQQDGSVHVPMPHAPQHGPAHFDAKQWADWWKLAK
ncbi:hypothetical protein [Hymenobacter terricola]|uniref:hypothetical protein n=1 Tax=Hymenobacter terricola TaxID=2819236 RepID=UPI001B315238|nr:hypothetical protein [Hymenobacter terricola]